MDKREGAGDRQAGDEVARNPYASRPAASRGRLHADTSGRPNRSPDGVPVRDDYQRDRDRIVHSIPFRRLRHKTQVFVAPDGDHFRVRLTHSLECAQVGRELGQALGCDPDLVDAACLAHDLGHPPFGHLGERVLDRLARDRFGLTDGFEGNAQTFRILTELEVHGPGPEGLNLTAGVRAAVMKYPWARNHWPEPHPTGWPVPPRGAGHGRGGTGAAKFSSHLIDLPEMQDALSAFPGLPPGRQTLECSVMDLADDIA